MPYLAAPACRRCLQAVRLGPVVQCLSKELAAGKSEMLQLLIPQLLEHFESAAVRARFPAAAKLLKRPSFGLQGGMPHVPAACETCALGNLVKSPHRLGIHMCHFCTKIATLLHNWVISIFGLWCYRHHSQKGQRWSKSCNVLLLC